MRRFRATPAFAAVLAAATLLAQTEAPHSPPSSERIHRFETQEIRVPDFPAEGYVLDIGGGGEGIIGQIKPRQTIAIDMIKRELEEAPAGPLKIVMDARDLKFLDGSFQTVTAFYTLMYVRPEADQEKVFREIHRVLAPGGRFLLWDVEIPARMDPKKDIAVFRFLFHLPKGEVKTGYGTFFPERPHDLAYFTALAAKTGFRVAAKESGGRSFFLTLTR